MDFTSPHNSCGRPGALPPPPGYTPPNAEGGGGGFSRVPATTTIGGISILKPRQLGGITAYDMKTGDKKWWVPNGNRWRDQTPDTSAAMRALLGEVILPRVPALGGQPEVIATKTLIIHGTGRSGAAGGGRGRGGAAGTATGGRGGGGTPAQLYAFDKATGRQVGAVNIPVVNSAVPMTFVHQGRQYVVFASGSGTSIALTALALPQR
jgi:quinoprotein glucose dehydrogenase